MLAVKPVYVEGLEDNEYKITAKQLREAITEKTKAVIINSPSNPTGMIYSKEELQQLGEVCLEHDILIVSDEIYEKLIYGGVEYTSIAQLSNALKNKHLLLMVYLNLIL